MYVFAAISKTKGDIKKNLGEKLDNRLLFLFTYESYIQIQWNISGISLFHFENVFTILVAKYS